MFGPSIPFTQAPSPTPPRTHSCTTHTTPLTLQLSLSERLRVSRLWRDLLCHHLIAGALHDGVVGGKQGAGQCGA
jgi:hypothetical protein